jgi:hypothetical protein
MERRESARIRFLEGMDRLAVTPQYRVTLMEIKTASVMNEECSHDESCDVERGTILQDLVHEEVRLWLELGVPARLHCQGRELGADSARVAQFYPSARIAALPWFTNFLIALQSGTS